MSASYAYHNRKAREPDRQDHEEHRAETVTRQLFHRSPRVDFIASTLPEDQSQGEDRQDQIEDPPGDQTDKTRDLRAAPRLMHRFTNRPRTGNSHSERLPEPRGSHASSRIGSRAFFAPDSSSHSD